MNKLKIFLVCCLLISFSACETYSDPEIEYSVIFPLSGEWIGDITGSDGSADKIIVHTYNTADESTTQMWLRVYKYNGVTGTTTGAPYAIRGKVNINLQEKAFSVTNELNNLTTANKFSVQNGVVKLESVTTPSNTKADGITFTYTSERTPDVTYTVSAFRRTNWPEDEF